MNTKSGYFSDDPYDGLATFDGTELHLAAVQANDFPIAEMPRLMVGVFPELFTALEAAGATMCGPPLALHTRIPTDTVDLAVGVPVTAPLSTEFELGSGFRVVATRCPAGPVAATSYIGAYEGLGDAWGRFMGEVAAEGHMPKTEFFEVYMSDPNETTDPSTLRTDLVVFLQ